MSVIIGNRGERQAELYFINKGFSVLERNYRFKKCEIDLILESPEGILVFVEVKYRKTKSFGNPEEFVSSSQLKRIQLAADNYQYEKGWFGRIRFDIVALTANELTHLEDIG